jgi:hypothetical protein
MSHKDNEREAAAQRRLTETKEDVRRSGPTGNDNKHHTL